MQAAAIPGVGDVGVFLGHASFKTTSIYLASGPGRQEQVIALRDRGRPILDEERDSGKPDTARPPWRGG